MTDKFLIYLGYIIYRPWSIDTFSLNEMKIMTSQEFGPYMRNERMYEPIAFEINAAVQLYSLAEKGISLHDFNFHYYKLK